MEDAYEIPDDVDTIPVCSTDVPQTNRCIFNRPDEENWLSAVNDTLSPLKQNDNVWHLKIRVTRREKSVMFQF